MKKLVLSIVILCGYSTLKAQSLKEQKKDTIKEENIQEVILTSSYGTKKLREEVVGSIVTLTEKDIMTSQPFESLDKMLIGLTPGVQIVNNPELGKPVDINVRGLGSLVSLSGIQGTSTQPLIVVDGVIMKEDSPFDIAFFDGGSNAEMNINPLSRFNSDNVESINILKDAAAVALYGAESANGVILITTKKGRKGKPIYSLTTQYGVSESINKIKYLSGQQYAQLYNDFLKNNNASSTGYPWNGTDVNWFDVMNRNGDFFRTNFNASGGKKFFTYRVGIDYSLNNESKVMNSFEKKGIDATLSFDFKKLKINLSGAYSNLYKVQPNTYFNFILAPDNAIYNPDGTYAETGTNGIPNPLAAANQNIVDVKNNSLVSSINASYELAKNLKLSTLFGVDYSTKENRDWKSGLNESGIGNKIFGRSRLSTSDALNWNWSSHLMYERNFGKNHHSDILVGMELRKTKDLKESHNASNFENFWEYQLPWNAVGNYTLRTLTLENSGRSFFSQINYDYAKKYFLTASLRRDESSSFGTDTDAALNGAVGASWLLSKEDFLKDNSYLHFLRLRASWGMTGNSRIGSYRSSGLYNVYENGFLNGYGYAYPDSSAPQNARLSWEKNEKWNLGLDVGLFNKIDLTLEVFRNNLTDMIIARDVPTETGYSSAEINGAEMYNQGIELSIRGNWISNKSFKWNTNFNISKVQNKVTHLVGLEDDFSISSLARAQKIGSSTSAIWGYEWLGINPANGQNIFMVNGSPKDANQLTVNTADYTVIGNSQPDFTGGFQNVIKYKNLSFSFLINFEIGGDRLVAGELIDHYNILSNRNMSVNALDYWTGVGDSNALNQLPKSNNKIIANSTKHLYDTTHAKLQNINISYALPLINIKNSFIKNASIFVDCSNVLYWYKDKSPEGKNGIREFRYMYPEMRTFSFGFKANF